MTTEEKRDFRRFLQVGDYIERSDFEAMSKKADLVGMSLIKDRGHALVYPNLESNLVINKLELI